MIIRLWFIPVLNRSSAAKPGLATVIGDPGQVQLTAVESYMSCAALWSGSVVLLAGS